MLQHFNAMIAELIMINNPFSNRYLGSAISLHLWFRPMLHDLFQSVTHFYCSLGCVRPFVIIINYSKQMKNNLNAKSTPKRAVPNVLWGRYVKHHRFIISLSSWIPSGHPYQWYFSQYNLKILRDPPVTHWLRVSD